MTNKQKYIVTAALPYTNSPIHIGHLAGAYLPADIYVRYLKQQNKEVVFVCGSDEHGAAITMQAYKENKTPQEIVDFYHQLIKKTFEDFGINFDIYHRTSSELHHQTAKDFFEVLNKKGVFEQKTTLQLYDQQAEQFLADRYVKGTCPNCSNPNAYGDQCEKCGKDLSPEQLINPVSTITNTAPVFKETTHFYFPLDKFQEKLENYIQKHPQWKKNVLAYCNSWLKQGLQPRAITRDLNWGVKVHLNPQTEKVLYVWFDAPIGYISATKQWAIDNQKNWQDYWQNPDTQLIHFVGKDNIVFHTLIFPAMLMAHGKFVLPAQVPANEFLNLEAQKISGSRKWAVWLHEYLQDFPQQQDALRYVLISILPETADSNFSWEDFQTRINSELVATLGNFVNRALILTQKNFDNKVPDYYNPTSLDTETLNSILPLVNKTNQHLENFEFKLAMQTVMDLARLGNKYLADTEPWKLIKINRNQAGTVLANALQIVNALSRLLAPLLPTTAAALTQMLNLDPAMPYTKLKSLPANHLLGTPQILFTKIEDDSIKAQIEKLKNNLPQN